MTYAKMEKELFAVMFALNKLEKYVLGKELLLMNDNTTLKQYVAEV